MRATRILRIVLGIVAAILACLSCLEVPMPFLVPCECDMTTAKYIALQFLMAAGFLIVAAGFAFGARWCFTGRGFKKRIEREIER
jgi:hypothetical protein